MSILLELLAILAMPIVGGLCGGAIGIVLGVLLLWLVIIPLLNYKTLGYWCILFLRENPPRKQTK